MHTKCILQIIFLFTGLKFLAYFILKSRNKYFIGVFEDFYYLSAFQSYYLLSFENTFKINIKMIDSVQSRFPKEAENALKHEYKA